MTTSGTDSAGQSVALGAPGIALTANQRAMWATQRRHPSSPLLNMGIATHIDGPIDPDRFVDAFARVVDEHRVLHSAVEQRHDGPVWVTVPRSQRPLTTIVDVRRGDVRDWVTDRISTPIDGHRALYDSALLGHEDGTWTWWLDLHHVGTDAASSALVFELTANRYHRQDTATATTTATATATTTPTTYFDWERARRSATGPRIDRSRLYWSTRPTPVPVRRLYRDGLGPNGNPAATQFEIDTDFVVPEYARAITDQLAWTNVLATAASLLLYKITGVSDFVIGVPVHHRRSASDKSIVGPLMEVAPVTITVDQAGTVGDLHDNLARSVMTALGHAHPGLSPAVEVDAIVNVIPHASLNNFGDLDAVATLTHPGAMEPSNLVRFQLTPYGPNRRCLVFDLNNQVGPELPERARGHATRAIEAVLGDPTRPLSEISLSDDAEQIALSRWGTGSHVATDPAPVISRLRDALKARADIVIDDGLTQLSGEQLWERVEAMARQLLARGIGHGDRVAIDLRRSIEAVVAIMATMLVGASYVPIDPSQPPLRRSRLAERAGVALIVDLDNIGALDQYPATHGQDTLGSTQPASPRGWPEPGPHDEAYLLFTSGSSGEPKGVPITQQGLADYVDFALNAYFDGHANVVAPLFSALTFDLTVTTLFGPLLANGRLVIIGPDGTDALLVLAQRHDLTWIKATPSHLELLSRLNPSSPLERIVVGGEQFSRSLARTLSRVFGSQVRLFNEYGPTEAVVGCMIHEAVLDANDDAAEPIPIGRPAPGVTLRIVDSSMSVLPLGASGELLISSRGVTGGYLDQRHDVGRFVEIDGLRWYRTGDLVRLIDDSTAVYIGRIDEQIKVGGVRLEPSEIEAALLEHPAIERAAVRLWVDHEITLAEAESMLAEIGYGEQARHRLTAWVQLKDGASVTAAELRSFASDRLQAAAVPTAYVTVDDLPVTPNGKLDVKALPAPTRTARPATLHVEPTTASQQAIVAAYGTALQLEAVSVDDDFFDLGGDSLAALDLAAALREVLGSGVTDALVFVATTPRSLAEALAGQSSRADATTATAATTDANMVAIRPTHEPPPLTAGESALLFEYLNDPSDVCYNVARRYTIEGGIDLERLGAAASQVAARHVPLSWTFVEPRRRLDLDEAVQLDVDSDVWSTEDFVDHTTRIARQPFDLSRGPLIRLVGRPLSDGSTGVLVALHHISIFAGTFDTLWTQICLEYSGQASPIDGDGPDFADVAKWQADNISQESLDFWSTHLAQASTPLDLGRRDGPDGYIETTLGVAASQLPVAGSTAFGVVLAAFAAALERRASPDDAKPAGPTNVAIGVTASTRNHRAATHLVGYELNTLPILVPVDQNSTVGELSTVTSRLLADVLPHRTVPLATIVADQRAKGRDVDLSVMVAFERFADAAIEGIAATHEVLWSGSSIADATLFAQVRGDDVALSLEYSGRRLDKDSATLLLADVASIIERAVRDRSDNDTMVLGALDLPSDYRPAAVSPRVAEQQPTDLVTMMKQAALAPQRQAAVVCGGVLLTWADFDRSSDAVAAALTARGVGRGGRVGVETVRSVDTVVAIAGVLKSGASYVPIDPTYPLAHRTHVVADAGIDIVIAAEGSDTPAAVAVSALHPQAVGFNIDERPPSADDEAYVIYTSGSSGAAKGVMVSHGNIAFSTWARTDAYRHQPGTFLMVSSMAFDSSMVGLWWPLAHGGTVVLPDPERHDDVVHLAELIAQHQVSHLLMLPSLYEVLLDVATPEQLGSLVSVIVAGETCTRRLVARHFGVVPGVELANEYGPTEATVWSHRHILSADDDDVPIGTATPGATAMVMSADGRPRPVGAPGELWIGGPGVAVGYVGLPELTAASFVDRAGQPVYRTGDLVDVDANGVFRFHGRIDNQVKIRGHRVELGAVEAALSAAVSAETGPITEVCVVLASRDVGGRQQHSLVGYVQLADPTGHHFDPAAIRATMRHDLAEHMVPTAVVAIDQFPRLPNGKLDRASLQRRGVPTPAATESGPTTESSPSSTSPPGYLAQERALETAWMAALGIANVGRDDDFYDLGGDSIVAIRIAAAVRSSGFRLAPRDLFSFSTIATLAPHLTSIRGDIDPRVDGPMPLTAIQRWFFAQGFDDPTGWTHGVWLSLDAAIDAALLRTALHDVVRHHESLSASFVVGGELVEQVVNSDPPAPVVAEIDSPGTAYEHTARALDLTGGRLVSAAWLDHEQVFVCAHHLVVDAVSWSIIVNDLAAALTARLGGTAAVLESRHTSIATWVASLADRPVPLDDRVHSTRTAGVEADTRTIDVTVDATTTAQLLALATSIDQVLAAAVATAVAQLPNDARSSLCDAPGQVPITLERHGREATGQLDLSRTVGWLTATAQIHCDPSSDAAVSLFTITVGL